MPQCMNGNWRHTDTLIGKGSLYTHMLDTCFRTRARAVKVNDGEKTRLHLYGRMMDRHQKAEESRRSRVVGDMKRTAEELDAYKRLLEEKYKVDRFRTMQWGFKPSRDIQTPRSFRRYQTEMKIYNCGFTKETLQPEVNRVIEDLKPDKRRKAFRARLLQVAQGRSNFSIDRRITDKAMRREQKEKEAILNTKYKLPEDQAPRKRSNTFLTTDGDDEFT